MVIEPVTEPVKGSPPLTVLYDGACPLCRREIGIYRGLPPLRSDSPVCFADVSGAQAFLALWAALPGWRWLALLGRLPGAAWVMERAYQLFLRWRPLLQRWAFRLDQPGLDQPGLDRPAPERPNHRDADS
ncbi:MAG: DUF393 domain-containing protein [Sterolibacteriaceae bacterium]|uniref:DUF393 domain-containing protein n=1 Tax=Candidatus Methylophosphatis roskildensis TaxID=2899263 RepID=A0A9D7HMB0_9PROT|nr:DUF393 domain-containing protein [Candidatus Methylophosphatis roskildensis]MBK7237303.1 DUF393 domain-containing protein [Sterolibacteriaceae bacterium]